MGFYGQGGFHDPTYDVDYCLLQSHALFVLILCFVPISIRCGFHRRSSSSACGFSSIHLHFSMLL